SEFREQGVLMDNNQFDNLIRDFSSDRSRRALVRLISGLAGGSLLASLVASASPSVTQGKGKHKGHGKGKKKRRGANCSDGKKNGGETDVDCGGGTCPRCAAGLACLTRNDCTTARCVGGICQQCADNSLAVCGTDIGGGPCGCRTHVSGQRFCTKFDGTP